MASDHLARLANAIAETSAAAAERPAFLVSITVDVIAPARDGEATRPVVEITRATRTLVFSRADLRGEDGRLLLSATAVHRV
jgi:hypothetical protein